MNFLIPKPELLSYMYKCPKGITSLIAVRMTGKRAKIFRDTSERMCFLIVRSWTH